MNEWDCELQAGGVAQDQGRWLAAYTRPKFEQKVTEYCTHHGIKVFLPTHRSWRRWSDRRKLLDLPLFPSYVFLHVTEEERRSAVRAPGFLWFVHKSDGPVIVSREELDAIRRLLASGLAFDPLPAVELGDEVELVAGPLRGCRGVLTRKSGSALVLQVSAIQASVRVQINDPGWIVKTKIHSPRVTPQFGLPALKHRGSW